MLTRKCWHLVTVQAACTTNTAHTNGCCLPSQTAPFPNLWLGKRPNPMHARPAPPKHPDSALWRNPMCRGFAAAAQLCHHTGCGLSQAHAPHSSQHVKLSFFVLLAPATHSSSASHPQMHMQHTQSLTWAQYCSGTRDTCSDVQPAVSSMALSR